MIFSFETSFCIPFILLSHRNSPSFQENQVNEPKSKWLSDAKRFNAQQIRRRMKEQKQRFDGKAIKGNRENASPQEGNFRPSKRETPQLAIAITMSEETDDPVDQTPHDRSPFANLESREGNSEDAGNDADASAWAMMEHYEIADNRSSPRHRGDFQERSSDSSLLRDASSFWDKSFTHEPGSLQLSPESQDASQSENTPSTITRNTQQIFVVSKTNLEEGHSPTKRSDLFDWNFKSSQAVASQNEVDKGHIVPWNEDGSESSVLPGPTPCKLRAHWIEEKKCAESMDSPPVSLLQESLILSDSANTTTAVPSFHTVPSEKSSVDDDADEDETYDQFSLQAMIATDEVSLMQMSKASFQPSINMAAIRREDNTRSTAYLQGQQMRLLSDSDPDSNTGTTRKPFEGDNINGYARIEKIEQLERHLKEQRDCTDDVQLKLKERVAELELVLRATAATPRGTIIQENPLKTLLDRNQTLVKEVRFADSTCVELSAKVSALEAERKILQDQVASLEHENKEIRKRNKLNPSLTPIFQDGGLVLRKSVDELKTEIATLEHTQQGPLVSLITSLVSDIDASLDRGFDGIPNIVDESLAWNFLAKALHAQTILIKGQNQNAKHSNSTVEELEAQSVKDLTNDDTEKDPAVDDPKLTLELSRVHDENDFLGRQLGQVQEKLDRTREELESEKKRAVAIDSRWKTQTASQLRKIKRLEDHLETASRSLLLGNADCIDPSSRQSLDAQVLKVKEDLVNVMTGLVSFRKEIQVMSSEEPNDSRISSNDAQITRLVAAALHRMRQQYTNLSLEVEHVVVHNCKRLENLSQTISFLRSSFMFEADSVSTEIDTRAADSPRSSLWHTQIFDGHVDDDLYSRMEEARGNESEENNPHGDSLSDFDDLSRFLSDDSTLESMLKTVVSEKSRFSDVGGWKKPLEAAVRECQRVRDRCVALKDELRNDKIAFSHLEKENQSLVLSLSLKDEEHQLVKQALNEAKARIQLSECTIKDVLEKKENESEKRLLLENHVISLQEKKAHLEEYLNDAVRKKEHLEEQLRTCRLQGDDANARLQVAQKSMEEHAREYANLKLAMQDVESRASEAENLLLDSRCEQENMRKERAELKLKLAKCEGVSQSLKEKLTRTSVKAEEQVERMSKAMESLQTQHDEAQNIVRRFTSVYDGIFAVLNNSDQVIITNEAESSFGVNWNFLEQVVPLILSALQKTTEKEKEVDKVQENCSRLQEDIKRAKEFGLKYQQQAEEEKSQNLKLFELLRQAELEMERSAHQIREMSFALSKLQQEESEMLSKTRTAEEEREVMRSKLAQTRNELCYERNVAEKRGNELSEELSIKVKAEDELRSTIDGLNAKCCRLRQYVKKLTLKCEEWEKSYQRQGKSLEKLQAKNSCLRDKVCEMSAKYKQISGHIKSKSRVSAVLCWT